MDVGQPPDYLKGNHCLVRGEGGRGGGHGISTTVRLTMCAVGMVLYLNSLQERKPHTLARESANGTTFVGPVLVVQHHMCPV
jgi:hypothetical protein